MKKCRYYEHRSDDGYTWELRQGKAGTIKAVASTHEQLVDMFTKYYDNGTVAWLWPVLSDGQYFDLGREACRHYGYINTCPYAKGTNAERMWLTGFMTELQIMLDERNNKK